MVKRNVDNPEPTSNQVLIEVMAAGVNPKDTYIRKGRLAWLTGKKFPMRLGHDLAGIVRKLGHEQNQFKEGDRVLVLSVPGLEEPMPSLQQSM